MPVEDKLAEREPPATAAVSQHEDSPATIQYSIPSSAGTMPQVLDIEPPRELVFTGLFTEAATATLTLHNPSEKIVCFIVKTTAPEQYCISPHTGFIFPGHSKTITVMLQSLDSFNPTVVARHKFKVLTCFVLNVDFVDLKGIWMQVDPVQLMESELMAVFEQPPATSAVSQHGHEDSAASIQDSSPSKEKMSQVLVIDPPHELVFTGPFTDVANATLTLHNPSEKTVCFKIDTTSPKQYCISPNPGIITPGQSKTIDVVHQPLDINPAEVARHQFKVQTCFAPDVDLEGIWETIDSAQLMHSELMAVFEQSPATEDVPQHHVGCEESLATATTSETPVPPEEDVVVLNDLIKEQDRYDQTQRALYGAMDDSVCTYPEGYKPRQPVLLCVTCATEDKPAGVCLGCASHCHDGHELLELFSKRNFRCDCGNEKFGGQKCTLYENKVPVNEYNSYNHNFSGLYCVCNDTYPGETEEEMIQCRMCEDWFHLSHLTVDTSLDKWKAVLAGLNSLVCRDCASTAKFPFMAVFEAADTPKCFSAFVAANPQTLSPQPLSLIPDWQKTICSCDKCKDIMDKCGCLFLLDDQDDLEKYEAENEAGAMTDDQQDAEVVNQLVGSVGREGAAAVLQGYNELKRNLAEFLYAKADKNEVIKKEDVDGFFAQLKKRRRMDDD